MSDNENPSRKRQKITQGPFPSVDAVDERIEKALQTSNYMATLSNQRRVIKEEFTQKNIYYYNGGTYRCDYSLIGFVKALVDMGQTTDVVVIDDNMLPVTIPNLEEFLENLIATHFEAANEFAAKFNQIKSKRNISDIVSL
jgi:hypothetical protein